MALTGNTVQSTYLDLVQLEKSGAGLPSHAGKQAALYDGGGNQILGRTAQPSWLDPHPDAASFDETFEFSTYGDANQAALESDGWTFENCTGEVAGGVFWLTATSTSIPRAYRTVSLTGNFDFTVSSVYDYDYGGLKPASYVRGGLIIGDSVSDVAYAVVLGSNGAVGRFEYFIGSKWSDYSGGTSGVGAYHDLANTGRLYRTSGTVYVTSGPDWPYSVLQANEGGSPPVRGWASDFNGADATTFNRLGVFCRSNSTATVSSGCRFGFRFVRRFA